VDLFVVPPFRIKAKEEAVELSRIQSKSQASMSRAKQIADAEAETSSLLPNAVQPPGTVPEGTAAGAGGNVELTQVLIDTKGQPPPEVIDYDEDQYSLNNMNAFVNSSVEGRVVYDLMVDLGDNYDDLKYYALTCFGFAMIGVFCGIAQRELDYYYGATAAATVLLLRTITTITTLALLYSLFKYHETEVKIECMMTPYLNDLEYWKPDRLEQFIYEALICFIHDPPGMNVLVDITTNLVEAPLSDVGTSVFPVFAPNPWSLIMFVRVYLWFRVYAQNDFSNSAKILGLVVGFDFNVNFSLRCFLDGSPIPLLGYSAAVVVLFCGYALHVCERVTGGLHQSIVGSYWCILIIMPTVGYGDIYPITYAGRLVGYTASCLAVLLMGGLTGAFMGLLSLAPYELRMVEFIELNELKVLVEASIKPCLYTRLTDLITIYFYF
jgi:hypothetical protein